MLALGGRGDAHGTWNLAGSIGVELRANKCPSSHGTSVLSQEDELNSVSLDWGNNWTLRLATRAKSRDLRLWHMGIAIAGIRWIMDAGYLPGVPGVAWRRAARAPTGSLDVILATLSKLVEGQRAHYRDRGITIVGTFWLNWQTHVGEYRVVSKGGMVMKV